MVAGHEAYPEHHRQYVQHKLGIRAGIDQVWPALRVAVEIGKNSDGEASLSCWATDCMSCACVMG